MARPLKIDEDEVLDRAIDAFWNRGWSATSIRELEQVLGLKAPSIYRRFGSKDGLTRAVLQRYIERVAEARIAHHLTGTGDPIENVAGFLRSGVTPVGDEPLRGCLLTVTALESPADGAAAELGDLLVAGLNRIEAGLRAELGRAEAAGKLAPGLSAAVAADQVALSFQGLMVLARAGVAPGDLQDRVVGTIDAITASPRR